MWGSNPRLRRDWCLKPAPWTTRPTSHRHKYRWLKLLDSTFGISYGGLAQSVECDVRNVEAAGSKPAFSILMSWAGGLVVWFSFRVREVGGSIPPQPLFTERITVILLFNEWIITVTYLSVIIVTMKNYFSLLPFWLSDLHRTTYCLSVMGFLLTTLLFVTKLHSLSGRRMFFWKKRGPRGIRTPDLSHPKRESYP